MYTDTIDTTSFPEDLFTPDFSEMNTPAPDGTYELMVFGTPKCCISKGAKTKGEPYLNWQLQFTGEHKKYGSIFERTMLRGKGAGRLFSLLRAVGLNKDDVKKFRCRPLEALTPQNAGEGVPAELTVDGKPFECAGLPINAVIITEKPDDPQYPVRNRIKKYL